MTAAAQWSDTTQEEPMNWRWEHHMGRKHLKVGGSWLCGTPYPQPKAVLPCEHCLQTISLMQRGAWDE